MGNHAEALRFYQSALTIAPGEPSVLSNMGLSFALTQRLPEAEQVLRQAAASRAPTSACAPTSRWWSRSRAASMKPRASPFRTPHPQEAEANIAYIRQMMSQAQPLGRHQAGRGQEAELTGSAEPALEAAASPSSQAHVHPLRPYSGFRLLLEGLKTKPDWRHAWRKPQPRAAYDVVIIGAGGHGLATAYHLAKDHQAGSIAVIDKGPLGLGNVGRNTTIIRSNYFTRKHPLLRGVA